MFGGVENKSSEATNDLLFLDLKEMYFSFPFTAGQYPEARYGHACCTYEIAGVKDIFLVGGMNKEFCTMDIFALTQIVRQERVDWEKIVNKTEVEEKASKRASNFIYQSRKYKVELYDLLIEEKTKG